MRDTKFQDGEHVEFDADADGLLSGVILNYLPPNPAEGFTGGYHIACYYVVGEEQLRPALEGVEQAERAFHMMRSQGMSEEEIAAAFNVEPKEIRAISAMIKKTFE